MESLIFLMAASLLSCAGQIPADAVSPFPGPGMLTRSTAVVMITEWPTMASSNTLHQISCDIIKFDLICSESLNPSTVTGLARLSVHAFIENFPAANSIDRSSACIVNACSLVHTRFKTRELT